MLLLICSFGVFEKNISRAISISTGRDSKGMNIVVGINKCLNKLTAVIEIRECGKYVCIRRSKISIELHHRIEILYFFAYAFHTIHQRKRKIFPVNRFPINPGADDRFFGRVVIAAAGIHVIKSTHRNRELGESNFVNNEYDRK